MGAKEKKLIYILTQILEWFFMTPNFTIILVVGIIFALPVLAFILIAKHRHWGYFQKLDVAFCTLVPLVTPTLQKPVGFRVKA